MSRCDPLNPDQLKRNGGSHSVELDEEELDSSDNESELDYLLDLVIDEKECHSESYESNEDESQTADKTCSTSLQHTECELNESISAKVLDKNSNSRIQDSPSQEISNDNPSMPFSMIIKVERRSPEPNITGDISSIREAICVPPSTAWEGPHNFEIKVAYCDNKKTTNNAAYCESKNKLYISKDYQFWILFKGENVPAGSIVRATAYYSRISDAYEVVRRCPVHIQEDKKAGKRACEHVLQTSNRRASYEMNEQSGRYSIVIPYSKDGGSYGCMDCSYNFTCWGSCISGINRRPFMIHFTLENNKVLLGRQILHIKVCACPLRDLRMEKERHIRRSSSSLPIAELQGVLKPKTQNPEEKEPRTDKYVITTEDPKLYEFLYQMKLFYETHRRVEYIMDIETYTKR